MKNKSPYTFLGLVAMTLFAHATVAQVIFDAAADFSATNNPAGVWSYGWFAPTNRVLTLYSSRSIFCGVLNSWTVPTPSANAPNVGYNPSTNVVACPIVPFNPHQLTFHPGVSGQRSVIRWTSPLGGTVTVESAFEGRDPKPTTTDVTVYHNNSLLFTNLVHGFGIASRVSFGTTVVVQLGDTLDFCVGWGTNRNYQYDTTQVEIAIEASALQAPFISRQPLSRTNIAGTTASFAIEVLGADPLSCQWRLEGTNLAEGGRFSGVTTTNLLIANVQPADAGGYAVVVTNAYGSVTSSVAQLTVVSPGRFSNLSYSPAMGFSFIFRDATVGWPYRIQRSPSMAEGSWVDWQSFTYTEPLALTDLGATGQGKRFYRAVSP